MLCPRGRDVVSAVQQEDWMQQNIEAVAVRELSVDETEGVGGAEVNLNKPGICHLPFGLSISWGWSNDCPVVTVCGSDNSCSVYTGPQQRH
jgi:hypothetical protein